MTKALFSYRFYARRTPGDEKPSVWCGDIDGPNVYKVRNHPLMLTARIHAWWRNKHRVPLDPKRVAANRGGDRMDTWADVG